MRYRIDIAYDGTEYAGWQIQPGVMTVQERIEGVLRELTGGVVKVHGSGRTDRGVHARGQVAHFDVPGELALRNPRVAINALLPSDIRVRACRPAADDFHARRSATGKEYRYFIFNGAILSPFVRRYRTHIRNRLDIDAMRAAARILKGRHDFAAFTANPNRVVESTVRRIDLLDIRRSGSDVVIVVRGDGFLYKMVRSFVGWLLRVGTGRVAPDDTVSVLASGERTARVPTAPPEGLFLWKVFY